MESDEALVQRTLTGDLTAYETLVHRHRQAVYRVAARIAGPDEADDVTQDTLLRALHTLAGFRGEASFRFWLLRIAHNAALTAVARRRREVPSETHDRLDPARTPATRLEDRERAQRLAAKIAQLPPSHRAVLVLRELEGLSMEEIATVTDVPLGTVKARLHRGRRELVELLRGNTYDWQLPA